MMASQRLMSQKDNGKTTFLSFLQDSVTNFNGFAVRGEAVLFDDDRFASGSG